MSKCKRNTHASFFSGWRKKKIPVPKLVKVCMLKILTWPGVNPTKLWFLCFSNFHFLSLAIFKYRQYFLILQTIKLTNKKCEKIFVLQRKKFGRIDSTIDCTNITSCPSDLFLTCLNSIYFDLKKFPLQKKHESQFSLSQSYNGN
jgi:hypothetical protein